MATGGKKDFSRSVKGSDYVFDISCNPCLKSGNNEEAVNYCVQCSEHFCRDCTKHHDKFGLTSGHKVVKSTQATKAGGLPKGPSPVIKETCKEHDGERLTTYCADHDVVVCNTCVSVDHRLCGGVSYIPKAAKASNQSKGVPAVKREITESLKLIDDDTLSLQKALVSTDKETKENLARIQDYTERVIKHARDLEKAATDDVKNHHKSTTATLHTGIKSLDDISSTMKDRLHSLDNAKSNGESQVFVDVKRGKEEVVNARKLQKDVMSTVAENANVAFVVNADVDHFLKEAHSLGRFAETNKACKAVLFGKYNVEMSNEIYGCHITDSIELSDGTLLIADYSNEALKRLDITYKVKECITTEPSPNSICKTSDSEVVVTLTKQKKVQFVNVKGSLKLKSSFTVAERCRGICHSRGELFVACGGHTGGGGWDPEGPGFIGVYDMAGSPLRTLQFDQRGRQLFTRPRRIASNDNDNKIHVTDKGVGVITLDRQGNVLHRFSDSILQGASMVFSVTTDTLLVCGFESHNILQINSSGEMVAELLSAKDGINEPLSVRFLRSNSRLMITENGSNIIKIYSLIKND